MYKFNKSKSIIVKGSVSTDINVCLYNLIKEKYENMCGFSQFCQLGREVERILTTYL